MPCGLVAANKRPQPTPRRLRLGRANGLSILDREPSARPHLVDVVPASLLDERVYRIDGLVGVADDEDVRRRTGRELAKLAGTTEGGGSPERREPEHVACRERSAEPRRLAPRLSELGKRIGRLGRREAVEAER